MGFQDKVSSKWIDWQVEGPSSSKRFYPLGGYRLQRDFFSCSEISLYSPTPSTGCPFELSVIPNGHKDSSSMVTMRKISISINWLVLYQRVKRIRFVILKGLHMVLSNLPDLGTLDSMKPLLCLTYPWFQTTNVCMLREQPRAYVFYALCWWHTFG